MNLQDSDRDEIGNKDLGYSTQLLHKKTFMRDFAVIWCAKETDKTASEQVVFIAARISLCADQMLGIARFMAEGRPARGAEAPACESPRSPGEAWWRFDDGSSRRTRCPRSTGLSWKVRSARDRTIRTFRIGVRSEFFQNQGIFARKFKISEN